MQTQNAAPREIAKSPTGIRGLDEVMGGGLPSGRPTLVCGSAGCGKTLLSMEFLVRGALEFDEPGLFVAFEESPEELTANVASLGFDLKALEDQGKLLVDYIQMDSGDIEESGEYDLEGLFVRLNYQIDSIGAKRVVIDTIETLFNNLKDQRMLRGELLRLFRWLKKKGVTAVITGERGDGSLTRHGLEEYISDCVVLLDHRVFEQISTRRLRIVKYRGTSHGANEYPFLLDNKGFTVLPVTSMDLRHNVVDEMITSGIERLDHMLGGGYYRGSSVLVSGTAGTGKSTILAHSVAEACARGERALLFSFEESPDQIIRNMGKVGLALGNYIEQGLLKIHSARPQLYGLEMHLAKVHRIVNEFQPDLIAMDPVTSLLSAGTQYDASLAILRLIDHFKHKGITAVFSCLTTGGAALEGTDLKISSLMDTWILLRNIEAQGERNRGLYVMKSRGANHSNQIREFVIGAHGVQLVDVYVGEGGVLTGAARLAQLDKDSAAERERLQELETRELELERKRSAFHAKVEALKAEFEAEELQILRRQKLEHHEKDSRAALRVSLAAARRADLVKDNGA